MILIPYNQAEARSKKTKHSVASKKSHKATKKISATKKKKSKIAKKTHKQKHKTVAQAKKHQEEVAQARKLKEEVGSKDSALKEEFSFKNSAAKVPAPELEIVIPEGDFHTDYEADSGKMEFSSQQPSEEFKNNEVRQ